MKVQVDDLIKDFDKAESLVEASRLAVESGFSSLDLETPTSLRLEIAEESALIGSHAVTLANGDIQLFLVPGTTENEAFEFGSHESLHSTRKIRRVEVYKSAGSILLEEGLATHFSYTHMLQSGRKTAADPPMFLEFADVDEESLDLFCGTSLLNRTVNNRSGDLPAIVDCPEMYITGFRAVRLIRDFSAPIEPALFLANHSELYGRLEAALLVRRSSV